MALAKSAGASIPGARRQRETMDGVGKGRLSLAITAATLLMVSIQVGLVVQGSSPVFDGILADPDAYMRLSRVERLWDTGAWYDPVFSRINPPVGLVLHWTRPMDALLLIGAWLAEPLVGFDMALYWWGVLISPVLQVLSLIALVWAAAPVLPPQWQSWATFLFVSQPGVFVSFLIGRPDHHGLLAVLAIVLIGLTIRLLRDPERTGAAAWFGLTAAAAVWVSVESLLIVAVAICALGVSWLSGDRRSARALVVGSATLLGGLLAALLVESGFVGLVEVDVDRLSGAHLTLFAINLIFWLVVHALERRGSMPVGLDARIGWAVLGAGAAIGAVAILEPALFVNPLDSGDSLYTSKHLAYIEELQPLFGPAADPDGAWPLAAALLWLGIAVPAVPWLLYRLARSTGWERQVWIFLGLGALAVLPLATMHRRWALYPEIFLLIPYAALAGSVLDDLAARVPAGTIRLFRLPIVCTLCIWFYIPTVASDKTAAAQPADARASACPIDAVAPILNDPDGLGASPKRVLAFVDVGPELLYRTHHFVYSIPNHRLQPGFATTYQIMTATDLALVHRLLKRARVDVIVVCPRSAEAWFYDVKSSLPTFHQVLSTADVPEFLEPVPLPDAIADDVKLFLVK